MDYIPAECAARSVGPSLQVVSLLLQTLTSSFCSQSSDKLLPKNCNVNDKGKSRKNKFSIRNFKKRKDQAIDNHKNT